MLWYGVLKDGFVTMYYMLVPVLGIKLKKILAKNGNSGFLYYAF